MDKSGIKEKQCGHIHLKFSKRHNESDEQDHSGYQRSIKITA